MITILVTTFLLPAFGCKKLPKAFRLSAAGKMPWAALIQKMKWAGVRTNTTVSCLVLSSVTCWSFASPILSFRLPWQTVENIYCAAFSVQNVRLQWHTAQCLEMYLPGLLLQTCIGAHFLIASHIGTRGHRSPCDTGRDLSKTSNVWNFSILFELPARAQPWLCNVIEGMRGILMGFVSTAVCNVRASSAPSARSDLGRSRHSRNPWPD